MIKNTLYSINNTASKKYIILFVPAMLIKPQQKLWGLVALR